MNALTFNVVSEFVDELSAEPPNTSERAVRVTRRYTSVPGTAGVLCDVSVIASYVRGVYNDPDQSPALLVVVSLNVRCGQTMHGEGNEEAQDRADNVVAELTAAATDLGLPVQAGAWSMVKP